MKRIQTKDKYLIFKNKLIIKLYLKFHFEGKAF